MTTAGVWLAMMGGRVGSEVADEKVREVRDKLPGGQS